MRSAIEPKKTAVLLSHQWKCRELDRLIGVVEDPPPVLVLDGGAIVPAGCVITKMIGDSSDHEGDVVHLELSPRKKGNQTLESHVRRVLLFLPLESKRSMCRHVTSEGSVKACKPNDARLQVETSPCKSMGSVLFCSLQMYRCKGHPWALWSTTFMVPSSSSRQPAFPTTAEKKGVGLLKKMMSKVNHVMLPKRI